MPPSRDKAFSLIELIIVIVIIGILASISAPMFGGMRQRAIETEEIMGLSAIRSSARQFYVERQTWPPPCNFAQIDSNASLDSARGWFPGLTLRLSTDPVGTSSLDGTYFTQECYNWNDSS